MDPRMLGRERELTALLIAPDRRVADQFVATLPLTRAFQIVGDLRAYPGSQGLDTKLRQLRPDLVFLDLASDLDAASELIRQIVQAQPTVRVVGLHLESNADAILRSLQAGASEFIYAPFDIEVQRDAITRLRRLCVSPDQAEPEIGKIVVFSSAKPGSGASTLAAQTAFALKKMTNKRVLLADFDLMGGTIGFYLKLNSHYSLLDALQHADRMDPALWSSLTVNYGGLDILPAPEAPFANDIDGGRLHAVLEYSKMLYDWVILDLPAVFYRISLMAMSECDQGYLVSTSELPSLHLARKAINLMTTLGIDQSRYQVVINRHDKRDSISRSDIEKLFTCPLGATFPNDYFSLHRVVTLGQPLGSDCELGKAVEQLAGTLSGQIVNEKKRSAGLAQAKPLLSQT
jgi:pilus assembly protein CpaE